MLKSRQLKAARSLLGWTQTELSEASGINLGTIKRMEKNDESLHNAQNRSVVGVQKALEEAGIEFLSENSGGVGVRLRRGGSHRP